MEEFLQTLLNWRYFQGPNPAIDAKLDVGNSKLVIITGDNACGKSFIRKLVQCLCSKENLECIHLSQQGRATSGIMRAMIYGSEEDESTGYISAKTINSAINTSRLREKPHSLFFDEPEIGLSENNSAAVGIKLKEFFDNPPANLQFAFVATHCRTLVRYLGINHWHLRLGGSPDLQNWLEAPIVPGNLEQLDELSLKKWQQIEKLIKMKIS